MYFVEMSKMHKRNYLIIVKLNFFAIIFLKIIFLDNYQQWYRLCFSSFIIFEFIASMAKLVEVL